MSYHSARWPEWPLLLGRVHYTGYPVGPESSEGIIARADMSFCVWFSSGPPKGEAGLSSDGRCGAVLLVSGGFGGTALRGRARDPTKGSTYRGWRGQILGCGSQLGGQLGWSPWQGGLLVVGSSPDYREGS